MKHIHLPLSEPLHARLMQAAQANGTTATQLAREAVEHFLAEQHQAALNAELDAYIAEYAGTAFDLDTELEVAGVELLLSQEP
ncbi:hypothetical protein FNU79_11935 [Deinococcus detaillensis]|uniref:CopG family transcriptional regulator n=1 Tax=Deinococcus detaillensis TaxID=2592048 RepID=A0A553UU11_9DEIO|nr:hypothetical protein [Deinococcus detaillensis]TSA83709.1 hypothetical protein FNU79_11935 [Deinococcus detaillensis]